MFYTFPLEFQTVFCVAKHGNIRNMEESFCENLSFQGRGMNIFKGLQALGNMCYANVVLPPS